MAEIDPLHAVGIGALGLVVGSFLNVVIARVPLGLSIVRPGSHCPKCGHQLSWYENVPVFSWILLRARCAACRQPISFRYPAVELMTGLLFVACLQRFGCTWQLASALVLVSLLLALTFIDLQHWILPFEITVPGAFAGIALALPRGLGAAGDAALGALAGFVGFWALEELGRVLLRKEALGGGDKFLLGLIGAYLTAKPLFGVVFLASLQGAIVGSALLLIRGRAGPEYNPSTRETEGKDDAPVFQSSSEPSADSVSGDAHWTPGATSLPFGPWLAVAAMEVLLLGTFLSQILPPALRSLVSDQ